MISAYNIELYNKVKAKIAEGYRRIFYSQATGLGKSIIMRLLMQNDFVGKRFLYISPTYSIWSNFYSFNNDIEIDCAMYAAFNQYEKTMEIIGKYDVVFVDECHHMYSDVQGKNIRAAMLENPDKFFIGCTATPKITDGLASDAFECSCYGLDIYDAIKAEILPKVRYAILVPKEEGNIISDDIISQIQEIVFSQEKSDKCLGYFTDIKELELYQDIFKEAFPEYQISSVHSKKTKSENQAILEAFRNGANKQILLSVNSILEGVHVDGVSCVISFRHTQKFNVFMQILGRLCKPYSMVQPVFIDVADSVHSINFDVRSYDCEESVIGSSKTFKDIIDVNCNEYKYVELYELLKAKDKQINQYKDYSWVTLKQLAKLLGVGVSAIYSWLRSHPGATVESYIDFHDNKEKRYRGVRCDSLYHLARDLHVSETYIKNYIKSNELSRAECIDSILGDDSLEIYTSKLNIVYYREVDCYDEYSISDCLNLPINVVRKNIKLFESKYKYIDSILGSGTLKDFVNKVNETKRFSYRGIQYDSKEDICEALGITIKTYDSFMQQNEELEPKDIIDYYL
ncbi:MAG: DEAD/DEAH box helicase family protein [Alphaproteobacteria bacterium]|nr:DEAD/DEAH box helicase family protein [Alphaproteobacteria bacterium]